MLADRARVLGGLPDVVTIQEGKVSIGYHCPCLHMGNRLQHPTLCSFLLHPTISVLFLLSALLQNSQIHGSELSIPVIKSCQPSIRMKVCLVMLNVGHFSRGTLKIQQKPLGCVKMNLKTFTHSPVTKKKEIIPAHTERWPTLLRVSWLQGTHCLVSFYPRHLR